MDNPEIKVEHTDKEFADAYTKLCQEYGFAIRPDLGYKQQLDGTFTISLRLVVDKLPQS